MHKEKIGEIYDRIISGMAEANEKNLSILPDKLCAKLALKKKSMTNSGKKWLNAVVDLPKHTTQRLC